MATAHCLERTARYSGLVVTVDHERVRLPDGQEITLEIIRHPGGAAAVALDQDRNVCLLRQYRHVAGGWLWELPAGKREPGETGLSIAQRELQEEGGVVAAHWQPLGSLHSSPGVFAEIVELFLATELTHVATAHEPGELIEVHWMPLAASLDACDRGEITDAKTLIGLYRAPR